MKNGVYGPVAELKTELTRQRAARQDLVADTRSLSVETLYGKTILTVNANGQEFNYDVYNGTTKLNQKNSKKQACVI